MASAGVLNVFVISLTHVPLPVNTKIEVIDPERSLIEVRSIISLLLKPAWENKSVFPGIGISAKVVLLLGHPLSEKTCRDT